MSVDQTQQQDGPPSRRASVSSTLSNRSDGSWTAAKATPGTGQTQSRVPSGIRQSQISMFSGRSDPPGSPASRSDASQSALSPGSIDRVFPIRSAVSIDSTATPLPRAETGGGFPGMNITMDGGIAARREQARKQSRRHSRSPSDRSAVTHQKMSSPSRWPGNKEASDNAITDDKTRRKSESSSTKTATTATTTTVDNVALNNMIADSERPTSEVNSPESGGTSLASRPGSVRRSSQELGGLVTARFKHVITDGGHAVITGRDGETLQRCEDEPIHIPGAVQGFGLLLAFKEEDGKLMVRVVSENSLKIIGYTPAQLFALDNLLDVFSEEQADNLLDHLDFIRDDEAADVVANGPEVFMISIRPPSKRTQRLWCAMHINDADKDLVICEFEIEDDHINPLVPAGQDTPEPPEDTMGSNPTPEELAESTVNVSKPLRVLRSARKKRGEAAAMEVFNIMSQVQEQLANAPTLQLFLRVLIGVVKELTGFHRVMIYQFDQSWNGRVVAELVDPRATKDLYKGLNFPASDIPKQARDLYKVNKVRLLYDRDQETARLVCRTAEDLEKPLDLTHAYLRAMSPIHTKYLANMAVRASMSISINAFNELWGLIACHSYGAKGMRVSFPIRKMCRLVGDTASRNIERLSYASRLQARKLINTSSTASNPTGYIVASSDDLLKLFDADVGVLSIRDETKVMGKTHGHLQEILAMVAYLRLRRISSVYTSQDVKADFPDLRYAPGLRFLAGLMYVPLSNRGTDFIAFFRKGVLQEVKWAGNPYEKFVKEGTEGYLEPRKSFKTWSETIVGKCRDWTEEEIETASVLCLVYGKFIDVWRQKEAALQNSQLTKLLLANSAHEVRTPLNAIINYLEIALESSLDQETRDNLTKSHSASKSLVYVINDLLDLTKAEDGKDLVKEELFNITNTLREATDPFSGDAKRKGIQYQVRISPDLPKAVFGDHRRVRQVVSNLVANAIQHTTTGGVSVDAWQSDEQPTVGRFEIEIAVEDTGAGMSQDKVDALFRELEEVSFEVDGPSPKLLESDPFVEKSDNSDKAALGLGLAVVARTIRNMNGQLRLKTEEGKGSRFVIQLGFDSGGQDDTPPKSSDYLSRPALTHRESSQDRVVTPSTMTEGEVMLVNRSAQKHSESRASSTPLARKASMESMNSLVSNKSQVSMSSLKSNSSHKSDVDRLIDAIQEPLRIPGPVGDDVGGAHDTASPTRQKSKSIGSLRDLGFSRPSSMAKIPGQENVQDSGVPIRPVRMPEEGLEKPSDTRSRGRHRVLFDEPLSISPSRRPAPDPTSAEHFSVLVAEDDPINSKIMKKRLEKMGHKVCMTVNGEECSSAHGEDANSYDIVLMDIQMPIVDGFTSTKMIRSFEKTQSHACLSPRARSNGRVPIFAVSASLVEREKDKYVDVGFDGWILKPVDFKRVNLLLKGIVDDETRKSCVYDKNAGPGRWEKGGWFEARRPGQDMYSSGTDTRPSGQLPTVEGNRMPTPREGDVLVADVTATEGPEDMEDDDLEGSTTASTVTDEEWRDEPKENIGSGAASLVETRTPTQTGTTKKADTL